MRNTLPLVVALLIVGIPAARAQFSSTITAVSDYDFRGTSLSAKNPALQVSADYEFSNGVAVGVWASNGEFGDDADFELDAYANYNGKINNSFGWTAGIAYYKYPHSTVVGNYAEAFVGFSSGDFSAKQWYADNYSDLGIGAWYTEANYSVSLSEMASLNLHAGYNYGDYWDDFGGGDVVDYAVGLECRIGHFNLGVQFTGTEASKAQRVKRALFNNEPRFYVSIATTLPWGE